MKLLLLGRILIIIIICCCKICRSEYVAPAKQFPRVITPLGIIEGVYNTTSEGKLYEAYLGIPYAKRITKNQRFELAEPVAPWNGVLSAKAFGPMCSQIEVINAVARIPKVSGSEDCLYLNVYTPVMNNYRSERKSSNDFLPVIIFIHGGGFQFGSAEIYRPDYLLNRKVILVTCNYRLGPFGFLSTEDETVPGNNGLKDQVIAMRFVKDNIFYFGGNPESITLIGQSAGAVSVHLHYLSNISEGLFNRGMSLSGNALDSWAQSEANLEKTKKLSTILGCKSRNVKEMINCLKTLPAEEITKASLNFTVWLNNPILTFGPVVEMGKISRSSFMTQPPIDLLISGQVLDKPWIATSVSEEGLAQATFFVNNATLIKELNDNWQMIAPYLLDFHYTIPKYDKNKISQLIRKYYLGNNPINKFTLQQLIRMMGDRSINYQTENAVKLQALATKSYVKFSYFSYRGAHSFTDMVDESGKNYGVSHGDDLSYVLKSMFDATTTQRDREIQKFLINFWVSFAKNGVPDVGFHWPRLNPYLNGLEYLHIAGPDDIRLDGSSNFGDKDFWQSIPFRENIVTRMFKKK